MLNQPSLLLHGPQDTARASEHPARSTMAKDIDPNRIAASDRLAYLVSCYPAVSHSYNFV